MSQPKIIAIVPTYLERGKYVRQAITSLLKQSIPISKIYIIDNNSGPQAKKTIHSLLSEKIKLITFSKNTGSAAYGQAIAQIYKTEEFDWLFLMDDDGRLMPDALEKLIFSKYCQPQTAMLACKRVDSDNNTEIMERGWFNFFRLEIAPIQYSGQAAIEIGHSSYMGMLINRLALKKIGFPNSDYYLYLDDVDFSLRLGRYGKMWLITDSVVVHTEPKRTRQRIVFGLPRTKISELWRDYYGLRNYFLLRRLSPHPRLTLFAIICRGLRSSLAILFLDDYKIKRLKLLLRALRDGWRQQFGRTLIIEDYIKNGLS